MSYTEIERIIAANPLFTITDAQFMQQYVNGAWWATHGEEQGKGAYADTYLAGNLKRDVADGRFNPADAWYRSHTGFYFGMLHGGILSPESGLVRPEATTLVVLTHKDSRRGYNVGRRAFFTELEPGETRYSEERVMEVLRDLVEGNPQAFTGKDDHLIYWTLGDLLGMLSGQVFPMTDEEARRWEHERAWWQKRLDAADRRSQEPESARRNTEPLTASNVLQEA